MSPVIRNQQQAAIWINNVRESGSHTVLDILINNHCMGIVGRTFTGEASGFGFAKDGADWVMSRGLMRRSEPPGGVPYFYGGGSEGHVVTTGWHGCVWQNDGPDQGVINYVPRSWPVINWGMQALGWCYATDIWGGNPAPYVPPTTHPAKPTESEPPWTRVLYLGSAGLDVRALQVHLHVVADWKFGPQTLAAVVKYQKARPYLWPYDGRVGPLTYKGITGHK